VKAKAAVGSKKQPPANVRQEAQVNVKVSISSKGRSKMAAQLQSTAAVVGESAVVLCQVDNSGCRLNMREIVVRLQQKIKLSTTDGKVRLLEKFVAEKKFPGVAIGQAQPSPQPLAILLPHNLVPTIDNTMVVCGYVVQVTGAFEGPFTNSMNVSLPLLILPPLNPPSPSPELPPGTLVSPSASLPKLTPPGTVVLEPLGLLPIPNQCRALLVIPGH
jgi:hypothetical protein